MIRLWHFVRRNTKLFFKDRGMLFTSLITPIILLVLYITFLGRVYRQSVLSMLPDGVAIPEAHINAIVGGVLFSSLLAVCCVTVAFCSNMLMVQDKVTGARRDLTVTPVKSATLSLGYYLSTALTTLVVCLIATGAGFAYLAAMGWYLSAGDVLLILSDVLLLVLFGTALSSVIHFFLSTQGQISAVGTVVSAGYGFVCGAYMPLSQFSPALRNVLSFLPGTYGTSLLRNHALARPLQELSAYGLPEQAITALQEAFDCRLFFFGHAVPLGVMYGVLGGATAALAIVYLLLNRLKRNPA